MRKLSLREIEIINHTAYGFTAKEIARIVGLEPRTVEAYMSNIKKKLGAKNAAHAICIALKASVINLA
ncbi:MAG: helix-turn-helix transcriptional regulator [Gammaproteobacteria bacterium]